MASKHSQPALYEKMGREPARPTVAAPPRRAARESMSEGLSSSPGHPLGSLLAPGRTVRLPVGYLLLSGGVLILVVWIAFMFGHNRGEGKARNQFEQTVIDQAGDVDVDGSLVTSDPLNDQENADRQPAGQTRKSGIPSPAAGNPGSAAKWGPVAPRTNPCRKGDLYFVLAETTEGGAKALADFCRGKGLETYVISGKNDRLRQVVAFPGFVSSARSSAGVKAVEAKIHQVGQLWKAANRNNSDLRDAYPKIIVP